MRVAVALGRFWWDFLIGDDWTLAAGVAAVLAIGATLVAATGLSDTDVSLIVGSGILGVVAASFVALAVRTGDPGGG